MAAILDPIAHSEIWDRLTFPGAQLKTPGKCVVGKWERKVEYDKKSGKGTKGATLTLKGLPPAEGTFTFWAWTPQHFAEWEPILRLLKFDPTKGGNSTTPAATNTPASKASPTNPGGAFPDPSTLNTGAASGGTAAAGTSKFTGGTATTTGSSNSQPALSSAYAIDVFHPSIAEIEVAQVLPPEELGNWEPDGDPADGIYKREIKFVEFTQPPNASIAATPSGANPSGAPGQQYAGGQTPGAPTTAADAAKGAGKDAQAAYGTPP